MSQQPIQPLPASADHSRNNFDLVRLFAAVQVVVVHLVSMMPGLRDEPLLRALSLFPGVPIFFFISGFLISGSWLRNQDAAAYVAARALRIFPALWVSCLFTLGLLLWLYPGPMRDNATAAAAWMMMQMSFLQSWNPEFLRGYGSGVANPVLWTIPVELSFYVVLPLLMMLGQKLRRPRGVLLGAAAASFAVFHVVINCIDPSDPSLGLLRKVLFVSPASFVTWLWMFLLGALAQSAFRRLRPLVADQSLAWGGLALAVGALSLVFDLPPWLHLPGNQIGLLNALTLGAACLSFAYSWPGLAARCLRGHDLSYGIYLFHMPIANALIATGIVGLLGAAITCAGTLVMAFLSWTCVERRALKHKKRVQAMLTRRPPVTRGVAA